MSFVSPRPLLVEYLDRYSPEQARRHEVKQVLRVGRRLTVAMPLVGKRNLT